MTAAPSLPVVDVAPLVSDGAAPETRAATAAEIARACREVGFFYIVGHTVPVPLQERLEDHSRRFFALAPEHKLALRMELAGRAWRGYFPVGGELTSGVPDRKEGLYFGSELPADHPDVLARRPLCGANLFPDLEGFRETLLAYLDALTFLGHRLMEALALGLGLKASYFHARYTADPLILFRVFHYPPLDVSEEAWSVGEHTDYGFLTILRQDDIGGLEVRTPERWVDAPPIENAFVCNLGDMLERLTSGLYRSTPHRVRNRSDRGRLSFPFFFDPNLDARIAPIDTSAAVVEGGRRRWDDLDPHALQGTYGDYLLRKVSRVFPDLSGEL